MTNRPTPLNASPTSRQEQLHKILEQEARTGYNDRAVIGGLDKLLDVVMRGERGWPTPSPAYARLNPLERELWISRFVVWLSTGEVPPPEPKKPVASPKPAVANAAAATTKATRTTPTTKTAAAPRAAATPRTSNATLTTRISLLPGVRKDMAAKLEKLGVQTIRDALLFYPSRHIDFTKQVSISDLVPGQEQTIAGFVWESRERRMGPRMRTAEIIVGDDTGNVRAVWFNQPYLVKYFKSQARVVLSGKVAVWRGQRVMENPEYELAEGEDDDDLVHTGRLVPVYPLTEGLSNRAVRRLIKPLVDKWGAQVDDPLPDKLRRKHDFIALNKAVQSAHYPPSWDVLEEARQRLAYDELLSLQLGALRQRQQWQQVPGYPLNAGKDVLEGFLKSLPFKLTNAQQRVLKEILSDINSPMPMSRLLQGDVGSGKTVVAAAALLLAVANGYQGAIMAPTEILAEQHYRNLSRLFGAQDFETEEALHVPYLMLGDRPLRVGLLVGSLTPKEKERRQQEAAAGEIDILVGTQALIQEKVSFSNLALAVVDEQHRFGVAQRASLRQKGHNPHILVMSATPIPRTLALTLYGDLENSVLDELPPGRQVIQTKAVLPTQRDVAYAFVREQISEGSQAFVVCPLIEESKAKDKDVEDVKAVQAATVLFQQLSNFVYPDLRLGLLHGRMPASEKDDVMQRFYRHELDILVSTTVIEVGIDVPNASVMLIEGADRFGLAQLHQLRGRVGRGERQSYCLLLTESTSIEAQERLHIMETTPDGFRIAEEDLRLRGPGEFFGTRQTGLPELRMARLEDWALLQAAREDAKEVMADDPELSLPEHEGLKSMLPAVPRRRQTEIS